MNFSDNERHFAEDLNKRRQEATNKMKAAMLEDQAIPSNPLSVQVGGSHYKDVAIQPVEYISANKLNFLEGCIVKRITRWRNKNGIEDLQKIKHEVDLLIEMEKKYGSDNAKQSNSDYCPGAEAQAEAAVQHLRDS